MVRAVDVGKSVGLMERNIDLYQDRESQASRDMTLRRAQEESMALDRALREGLRPAVQAPVAAPAPAAPAGPAYESIEPAHGGDTPIGDIVQERAPAAAPVTAAPERPAISAYTTLMERLAGAPGGGRAMLTLHGQEQTRQAAAGTRQQAAQNQGWSQFNKFLDDRNVDAARTIAKQYQLGIPDEAWTNIQFRNSMLIGNDYAKSAFHIQDPDRPVFLGRYMERIGNGEDPDTAAQGALTELRAPEGGEGQPRLRGRVTTVTDQKTGKVYKVDQYGNKVEVEGVTGRVFGGGRGGAGGAAGGKQQQYAQWRIQTLVAAGVPLVEAQRTVAGGERRATSYNAASIAARLFNAQDEMGRRLYPTYQHALKAAQEALGQPLPQPGAPPAPGRPPLGSFGNRPPLESFERR